MAKKIPLKVPTNAECKALVKSNKKLLGALAKKSKGKAAPVVAPTPARTKKKPGKTEKSVTLDPMKPAAGFPPAVEPIVTAPSQPAAVAEQPAVALPPAEPAAKARKPRFAAGHKKRSCPGECGGTGVVENHPCPSCQPAEYVAAERAKRGACLHQDVGFCPACDRREFEREGARGSVKGTPAEVFAVFRDYNGVVYLRVAVATKKRKADLYIVNKALSVELVSICYDSAQSLYLQPVAGASVYEAARRLFTPLNDQATISICAKEYLTDILNNKELEMKATPKTAAVTEVPTAKNAAPVKRAKFETTNPLPAAAKGKKAAAVAAAAPVKAAKATKAVKETPVKAAKANGKAEAAPKAGRKVVDVKITILEKKNPYREGSKCYVTYELLKTCKTTGDFRAKLAEAPKGTYDMSFPSWPAQVHGKQPIYVKLG